jgi:hypothetical protein
MRAWAFLYIYLAGAALIALRVGWHIRFRLDKYDRMFSDVRWTLWNYALFWPVLLVLSPKLLITPSFSTNRWNEGKAETERELDRMAQNLPPCGASIRYAPEHDEAGACDSEFVFDAADVEKIMATRLADMPAEQHGRYAEIFNWLRQRDNSTTAPSPVPTEWNGYFLKVAVGMMNRGLGQVKCGECGEVIPQEHISLHSTPEKLKSSGWSYTIWVCPHEHKLLTKHAMHFSIRPSE